ncbi:MAG: hypothetical protein ABIJ14_01230 [Nanoarchaeota archaeon]|nr:hypothetical protein [Nanoarchaeota archaeon]
MKVKYYFFIGFLFLVLPFISAITIQKDTQFKPSATNTTFIMGNNLSFDLVEVYSTYIKLDNNTFFANASSGSLNITIFNFTDSYKQWNETCSNSTASVNHTIGNFSSGDKVVINKNSSYWNTFNANSSGYINFNYNEGYSTLTFEAQVDNTAPVPSISCLPNPVGVSEVIVCSCSATDNLDSSPDVSYTINPSTSSTGTFTTSCTATDDAGNSGSASTTYTVSSSVNGGNSRGDSSNSFWSAGTYVVSEGEFEKGLTKQMAVKSRIRVPVNNEYHYVGVREITQTSVTIEISSEPIQIKLNIGQDVKVDVDGDLIYDVYVKLNSISGGLADLLVQKISEAFSEGEESPVKTEGEVIEDKEDEIIEEESNLWLWVVMCLVVALVIAVGVWYKKKKRMFGF